LVAKIKNLARSVTYVVYAPTELAYGWIFLGYVVAGLSLYFAFMAGAYKMELFKHVKKWPVVSRAALYCGPVLMALGCYFSTRQTSYFMLIPVGIYAMLGTFAYRALVKCSTLHSTD